MTFDRRSFVAGLGAVAPAALTASCARAADMEWPGPDTPPGQRPRLPIGMNLAAISDFDRGFPFKNLLWGARDWLTRDSFGGGAWNTEQIREFEFDADGYPLEVPIKTSGRKAVPQQIFTILPNTLKPGRYVILHEGEGSFEGLQGTKVISEAPGRVEIHMTQDLQRNIPEGIIIRRSQRGNHLRNIRIVRIEHEKVDLEKHPFLDEFLEFCRPFHALRFMDWQATNGSIEADWAGRRRPTFFTMRGFGGDPDGFFGPKPDPYRLMFAGGVAHEVIIQLANTLGIDPWICLPHRATDEYIRECARLYRARLNRNRRVYVEYSNELWNWSFIQAQWMLRSDYAARAIEDKGLNAWDMRDGKKQGTSHPERIGALFSRAYRLWTDEWQGADRSRCTMVCGVQATWSDASLRTIDWCHRYGIIDAVAPAGYFGPDQATYAEWGARGAALTGDEVIASMRRIVERQGGRGDMYRIARRAADYGLTYLNYEGGQHIQPQGQQNKPYMPALLAAQTHPQMYDLYVENLKQQRRLGCKLFCAYTSIGQQGTQYGSWGVKTSFDAPNAESPKYRALIDCNS